MLGVFLFFTFSILIKKNVAHSIVAKQIKGDITFHIVPYFAVTARFVFLWGPRTTQISILGSQHPCLPLGWLMEPISSPHCVSPALAYKGEKQVFHLQVGFIQ